MKVIIRSAEGYPPQVPGAAEGYRRILEAVRRRSLERRAGGLGNVLGPAAGAQSPGSVQNVLGGGA